MYNHDMSQLSEIITDIEKNCSFSFSRSSGPGGQNVNKLNTNVMLTMPVSKLSTLNYRQQELLRFRLSNRMNSEDELFVQAQQERSQFRNRQLAVARLARLIIDNIHEVKPRRKTKPSRGAKERRLREKKKHSDIKKSRGRPTDFS